MLFSTVHTFFYICYVFSLCSGVPVRQQAPLIPWLHVPDRPHLPSLPQPPRVRPDGGPEEPGLGRLRPQEAALEHHLQDGGQRVVEHPQEPRRLRHSARGGREFRLQLGTAQRALRDTAGLAWFIHCSIY